LPRFCPVRDNRYSFCCSTEIVFGYDVVAVEDAARSPSANLHDDAFSFAAASIVTRHRSPKVVGASPWGSCSLTRRAPRLVREEVHGHAVAVKYTGDDLRLLPLDRAGVIPPCVERLEGFGWQEG
jgi:hypothetical protein